MQAGGDALNESVILSRLGHGVSLITKLGADSAAAAIRAVMASEGISRDYIIEDPSVSTSVNIVLIRGDGERSFVTGRNTSLRNLTSADVIPMLKRALEATPGSKIVSFASTFVSYAMPVCDMAELFRHIKGFGLTLCADTTTPKHGETLDDVSCMLGYVDYFFPNIVEARMLTGKDDPDDIASALLDAGVSTVVLKLGKNGCLIRNKDTSLHVPSRPGIRCVDTTGAGDNFAAGFISALLEGRTLFECGRYANAVASVCVGSLGATTGVSGLAVADSAYIEMLDR